MTLFVLRVYSREGNYFPNILRLSWTKMSEISMNTVENIDEVDQISLLTTCNTKLHRSYRVTLHFLQFHQNITKNSTPLLLTPPFITLARVGNPGKKINFLFIWCIMMYRYLSFLQSHFYSTNFTFHFIKINLSVKGTIKWENA